MDNNPKRVLAVGGKDLQELQDKLIERGYEVVRIEDGNSARQHVKTQGMPHLMVVELQLPDMDGLQLCRELYKMADLPIITISNNASTEEAVEALKVADDYTGKPFAADELVMRVWRVLSRISDFSYATGPTLQLSDWLVFDPAYRKIIIDGKAKKLTPTENALFNVLIKYRDQVVSADTLIQRVWRKEPTEGDRNALRVHMHRLRNKLTRALNAPPVIITERGVGYAFVVGKTID